MKKSFTLLMALSLVMSLMAMPVNPKAKQDSKGRKVEQQVEQTALAREAHFAADHVAKMNVARPEVRKVVAKKNVARTAVRKAVMEETTTFTYTSISDTAQTKSNITVKLAKGGGQNAPAWNDNSSHLRLYANNTITVSAKGITKVELTFSKTASNKTYADMSASTGKYVSGGTSTAVGESKTDTWTGDVDKVVFTMGESGQRVMEKIVVTLGGQGGGGGGEDEVVISGLTQAYAILTEEEGYHYWDFDLAAEFSEEGITYPELYFMCDEEANSETSIVGTYEVYYAGVWNSAKDSVETDEDEAVGTMTVTYVQEGIYNFEGSFEGADGTTYTWNATNVEVVAVDADNDYEEIELDEEGGGSVGDTIKLAVNTVQAMRYDSYSEAGSYIWTLNAMDYTSQTQFESMWFYIYTTQNNRLEGEYNIENDNIYNYYGWYYYTGYTKVNGTDTTATWAGTDNIELVIAYDEVAKAYDMFGEFLAEDGKTLYQFEVENINIEAFNEEEVDITLMDSVAFVPDTIAITGQDAIEFAYYASYSEEGAYNYSVNLYNEANTVPYLALDVYSDEEGILVGTYCEDNGNVGEYSGFYPTMDDQLSVSNLMCTITENAGVYTVKGSFTGSDMNIYTFEVTATATMADGDYPYEPMEKQPDITMNVTNHAFDDSYFAYYSEVDVYFYNATDTIQLWVATSTSTLADGTYTITTAEEANDGEMYAGYYSSYGMGGCVAMINGDLYYLVSGTLTIATSGNQTTLTLDATSAHGTKIGCTYVIENPTGLKNVEAMKQNSKFMLNDQLYIQKNGVLFNAQGQIVK